MGIFHPRKSVCTVWCLLHVKVKLCSVRGFQQTALRHITYTLLKSAFKQTWEADHLVSYVAPKSAGAESGSKLSLKGEFDILICRKLSCPNKWGTVKSNTTGRRPWVLGVLGANCLQSFLSNLLKEKFRSYCCTSPLCRGTWSQLHHTSTVPEMLTGSMKIGYQPQYPLSFLTLCFFSATSPTSLRISAMLWCSFSHSFSLQNVYTS